MNSISLQKLLYSTQSFSSPLVKLENIIQNADLNILKSEQIVNRRTFMKGTCFLCGVEGELDSASLSSNLLQQCEFVRKVQNSFYCCSVCGLFTTRINELDKSHVNTNDELDAIASAVRTVCQLQMKTNSEGSSSALSCVPRTTVNKPGYAQSDVMLTRTRTHCASRTHLVLMQATQPHQTSAVRKSRSGFVNRNFENEEYAVEDGQSDPPHGEEEVATLHNLKQKKVKCRGTPKKPPWLKNLERATNGYINPYGPHQCYFCQNIFPTFGALKRHIKAHTNEFIRYICVHCGSTLRDKNSLISHVKIVHGLHNLHKNDVISKGVPKFCYFCGRKYYNLYNLSLHMRIKHTKEFTQYRCRRCGKVYFHIDSLRLHVNFRCKHEKEDGKILRDKYLTEKESGKVDAKCYFCKKRMLTQYELVGHIRKHTMERDPFKCDDCEKVFCIKRNFISHRKVVCYPTVDVLERKKFKERIKLRNKKYNDRRAGKCPKCCKNFRVLVTHMNNCCAKADARKTCLECNKVFESFREKMVHDRKEHQNMATFKCYFCSMELLSNYLLLKHMVCHTKEMLWRCEIKDCGVWFPDWGKLQRHKGVHHERKSIKNNGQI